MIEKGQEITNEIIEKFFEGYDPMERIVNLEYNYRWTKIKVFYRNEKDQKCIHWDGFKPFVWAKRSVCLRMCGGDRKQLKLLMFQYGIGVKALDTTDKDGNIQEDLNDGYAYLFYAQKPTSMQMFTSFFSKAGVPLNSKKKKDTGKIDIDKEYLMMSPQEMYLISTGKRFFKGYNNYDDVLRLIFDLETEGLDPKRHRIIQLGARLNRPTPERPNGFEKIFTVTGDTKEEKDYNELKVIDTFMRIIYTFQPDIITAHNGENFDWNFIIERCNQLGTNITDVSKKYFEGESIFKSTKESSLKLGGESEKYFPTNVPGCIVTDSLHAVRRKQATDSNFKESNLKYASSYLNLKKKNRVYTPGSEISNIWADTEHQYAFCEEDGDWYIYDETAPDTPVVCPEPSKNEEYFSWVEKIESISLDAAKFIVSNGYSDISDCSEEEIDKYITRIYKRGDDIIENKEYLDIWKKEFSIEKINTIINDFIHNLVNNKEIQLNHSDRNRHYATYLEEINKKNQLKKGKTENKPFVVYTRNYIADGYKLTTGRDIVERYLLDDIWECDKVESVCNTTNFLICKILPEPFQKCCTMGTAGQWKALLLAWCYENNLAVPSFNERKRFTGGLSRLLVTGYIKDVIKLDYNSLYPSIILTWAIEDAKDTSGVMLKMLNYVLTQREFYKKLKKEANAIVDELEPKFMDGSISSEELVKYNDAKADFAKSDMIQCQMKVLGNSIFGSFGAPHLFPFGSTVCAERTTCTGRMALRLMISHFSKLGYKPLVGDSFTPDTPIFVKYDDGLIDIKPIEEIISLNEIKIDALGREYDYSKKNFKVLCRSGWVEPSYIYRHKTDKEIYRVSDNNGVLIDVTEDHSLLNDRKEKIKPSEINNNTQLEFFDGEIKGDVVLDKPISNYECWDIFLEDIRTHNSVSKLILNATEKVQKEYLKIYHIYMDMNKNVEMSKTFIAGIQYLANRN